MTKNWSVIARNLAHAARAKARSAASGLHRRISFAHRVSLRNHPGGHRIVTARPGPTSGAIIGMIRLRNEGDILQDTLDHLATIVDGVLVYDDSSTDDSVAIALAHPAVFEVIVNRRWRSRHRIWEETANRRILYRRALRHQPAWVFYSDADERFVGDIGGFLRSPEADGVDGVRVALFDAYLTPEDSEPVQRGHALLDLRKAFGPERRNILMAWRPTARVDYRRPDSREPEGVGERVVTRFACQHYGKAISVEQWEATCEYYLTHFPEIYRARWEARRGRAIHHVSDFGRPLHSWSEVENHAVDI